MPMIRFPYGKTHMEYDIPAHRYAGTLVSEMHAYVPKDTPEMLVEHALSAPIGTEPLSVLARGKKKIVLIASDHTRPVPSRVIVPPMLREIRRGNPEADVTILIATGCHRETTKEELVDKFGEEIVENEKIVIHDSLDEASFAEIGTLPSGGRLVVNRLAAEADLLVAEGFIEPHLFAGFSGGRKSVLPGICKRETVMYNHNAGFLDDPHARSGILEGNPIHRDMLYAAKAVGLSFIVNVVINAEKEAVFAVAGDVEAAHLAGCAFLNDRCRVKAIPSDIVITTNGGYPLDQNIYQAVKGMTAAEATVKKDGVVIMLASSVDGHGGDSLHKMFREAVSIPALMQRFLDTKPEDTPVDQWQAQVLARILMHASVIYVSDAPDELVRDFSMTPAHSVEEAVRLADEILRENGVENGTILAIPDGISVVVGT